MHRLYRIMASQSVLNCGSPPAAFRRRARQRQTYARCRHPRIDRPRVYPGFRKCPVQVHFAAPAPTDTICSCPPWMKEFLVAASWPAEPTVVAPMGLARQEPVDPAAVRPSSSRACTGLGCRAVCSSEEQQRGFPVFGPLPRVLRWRTAVPRPARVHSAARKSKARSPNPGSASWAKSG